MRKILIAAAAFSAVLLSSCSGTKQENAKEDNSAFEASQPLKCGEYRAVSFQDTLAGAQRTRFDGRVLVALEPDNSGIYIYENGNRTHFKSSVSLEEAFSKEGNEFVAKDNKGRTIRLLTGNECDTLMVYRSGQPVYVAFEKSPLSELTPTEAWTRISSLVTK